ncbi:hypothetical protein [Nocardia sp. BMG51109]|uniref:hypothetical protein n=1 Tax=Nocardia sp. BMG51109 TaxID=1056816 RepID=UPI000464300F|nr:hypothetical protein [Nocardia sp. BMG51109]
MTPSLRFWIDKNLLIPAKTLLRPHRGPGRSWVVRREPGWGWAVRPTTGARRFPLITPPTHSTRSIAPGDRDAATDWALARMGIGG